MTGWDFDQPEEPAITLCVLCNEPVENEDQPEGAEVCNSCARYLDARFGPDGGEPSQ